MLIFAAVAEAATGMIVTEGGRFGGYGRGVFQRASRRQSQLGSQDWRPCRSGRCRRRGPGTLSVRHLGRHGQCRGPHDGHERAGNRFRSRLDRHLSVASSCFARDPIVLPWTSLAGWRPTVRVKSATAWMGATRVLSCWTFLFPTH
jgi:hypothetical protein